MSAPSVCIVGAGPGGLAMARLLSARGYTVTVLEQLDRPGGMCHSVEFGDKWFDIGANYVTKDYREVRALAKEFGLTFVSDKAFQNQTSLDTITGETQSVQKTIQAGHGMFAFLTASVRYFLAQWKYRQLVAAPGYVGVAAHTELMTEFGPWLRANRMAPLQKLFMIPITAMGFGTLDDIPAPHALRYINARRFLSMLMTGLKIPQRWPKRFTNGFGSAWCTVAEKFGVEYETEPTRVVRSADAVAVHTKHRGVDQPPRVFDHLVLSCPPSAAMSFLDATETEQQLFGGDTIQFNRYSVTTARVTDFPWWVVNTMRAVPGDGGEFPPPNGSPYIFGKQWKDSELNLYYAPLAPMLGDPERELQIVAVSEMSLPVGSPSVFHEFVHYANWPQYFPRVSVEHMAGFHGAIGWYDQVEALQGQNRTYWCHGTLSFELVELVMRYARHLTERHFTAHADSDEHTGSP